MTLFHDAFYRFVRLDAPDRVAAALRELAAPLFGSILVAPEGINAMLAGSAEALDTFRHALAHDRRLDGHFAGLDIKRSACTTPPFARLKVHVKPEIVPLGIAGVDACGPIGTLVSPAQWLALLADPEVLVIDNRNHFEFRLGRFRGAVNPNVNHFRDFPAYVLAHLDEWRTAHRQVAMYCTGGIRCEKSGAWMHALGLPVAQLDGGILNYFRAMPAGGEQLWEGECFVFDNRVALDARLQETDTTLDDVYDAELDGAWRVRRARLLDAA